MKEKKHRKAKLKRGGCIILRGPKTYDGKEWQSNAYLACSMKSGIRMRRICERTAKAISDGDAGVHAAQVGVEPGEHVHEEAPQGAEGEEP